MITAPAATKLRALTAIRSAPLTLEMMVYIADWLNMREDQVSLGSLEMDSQVAKCTEGVKINMEEEIVRNGSRCLP